MRMRARARTLGCLLALAVAACGGGSASPTSPTTPPGSAPRPVQVGCVTVPGPTLPAGVTPASVTTVRLLDSLGAPSAVAGVSVAASTTTPGVTITGGLARTDANGVATFPALTLLGPTGTSLQLRLAATGLVACTAPVTLVAGPVATITAVVPIDSAPRTGVAPVSAPAYRFADAAGNPLVQAGVPLTVQLATGTLAVSGATATTDSTGIARFPALTFTGSTQLATLRVTSASPAVQSALFTIRTRPGPVAHLLISTPPPATMTVDVELLGTPAVRAVDAWNNGVAGVPVGVTVPGVQVFIGQGDTTDVSGTTAFRIALRGPVGSHRFSFTSPGLATVTAPNPTQLLAGAPVDLRWVVPPPDTVRNGDVLVPGPLAQTTDAAGNPKPDPGKTCTSTVGGFIVADANGRLQMDTANIRRVAGPFTFKLSCGYLGPEDPRTVVVVPGAPWGLRVTTDIADTARIGVPLTVQPVVRVTDYLFLNDTPSAGRLVTASVVVPPGGAPITITAGGTAVTDAAGVARFSGLTLSGTPGRFQLVFNAGLTAGAGSNVNGTLAP